MIPWDSRGFWGFSGIFQDSARILEISPGFYENCTRFLKFRALRDFWSLSGVLGIFLSRLFWICILDPSDFSKTCGGFYQMSYPSVDYRTKGGLF